MIIFNGVKGLLGSKKACMSLIVLACATAGMLTGHIDGMSFSAVMTVVSGLYCWTAHKIDLAGIQGVNP